MQNGLLYSNVKPLCWGMERPPLKSTSGQGFAQGLNSSSWLISALSHQ